MRSALALFAKYTKEAESEAEAESESEAEAEAESASVGVCDSSNLVFLFQQSKKPTKPTKITKRTKNFCVLARVLFVSNQQAQASRPSELCIGP